MGEFKTVTTQFSWVWDYEKNGQMSKTEGRWIPINKEVKKVYDGVKTKPTEENEA